MNQELDYYNTEYDTSVRLNNTAVYVPMPNQKDGWQWTFSNKISFVDVGGPEDNLEEAYFIAALPNDLTEREAEEIITEICAFTSVIWGEETDESVTAYLMIADQIISGTTGYSEQIGNKIIITVSTTVNEIPCLAIGIMGQKIIDPLPPWWTFLAITSGTIGVSTFIYKVYKHFKGHKLPPPPPPL